MTKKEKRRAAEKSTGSEHGQSRSSKADASSNLDRSPWISMKTGIIVITVVSLFMTVLTAWQAVPLKGWLEGILTGIAFGGAIWLIFLGSIFVNRFLRGKP